MCLDRETAEQIARVVLSSAVERGFLLGTTAGLGIVTHWQVIPPLRAGTYFFTPDTRAAKAILRQWADQGICFCGFLHAHPKGKDEVSQHDWEFAYKLLQVYSLPMLWFGLAVRTEYGIQYRFYQVTEGI